MIIALSFLLGGAARALIGGGWGPSWIGRWSVYPVIAVASVTVGTGLVELPLQTDFYHYAALMWAAPIASLNLAMGRTKLLENRLPTSLQRIARRLFGNPKWDEKHQSYAWDWDHGRWMDLRFGLLASIAVLPLLILGHHAAFLYPLFAVCAGLFYPHRQRVFEWLCLPELKQLLFLYDTRKSWVQYLHLLIRSHKSQAILDDMAVLVDNLPMRSKVELDLYMSWLDSSRLAEFVAGACILGGLSIL